MSLLRVTLLPRNLRVVVTVLSLRIALIVSEMLLVVSSSFYFLPWPLLPLSIPLVVLSVHLFVGALSEVRVSPSVVNHLRTSVAAWSIVSSMAVLVAILICHINSTVNIEDSLHCPDSCFSLEELTVDLNNIEIVYFSARYFSPRKH